MRDKQDLLKRYDDVIQYQLKRSDIEQVVETSADAKTHHLPHHAVITPQKTVRVVFDALVKTRVQNNSHSDCLYR